MHASLANLASRPLVALLAFAGWALVLLSAIFLARLWMVLTRQRRVNEFPAGQPHGGDAYWRLNRAHLNAVENLPIFAAIVLAGAALGVSSPRLAQLAEAVVIARVAQSTFHVASGSALGVSLRFSAFFTQYVCFAWMIVETVRQAASG